MFGNFSRNSFDPQKNYTRVLIEQGSKIADYQWNEQAALLLHQFRMLGTSIYSWHGTGDDGFLADQTGGKISFRNGHYVVDGIPVVLMDQAEIIDESALALNDVIYLEVWESSVREQLAVLLPTGVAQTWQAHTQLHWKIAKKNLTSATTDSTLSNKSEFRKWASNSKNAISHTISVAPNGSESAVVSRRKAGTCGLVSIHSGGDTPTFKWTPDAVSHHFYLNPSKSWSPGSGGITGESQFFVESNNTDFDIRVGQRVEVFDKWGESLSDVLPKIKSVRDNTITTTAWSPNKDADILLRSWRKAEDAAPAAIRIWEDFSKKNPDGTASDNDDGIPIPIAPNEWASLNHCFKVKFDNTRSYVAGEFWPIAYSFDLNDPDGMTVHSIGQRYSCPLYSVTNVSPNVQLGTWRKTAIREAKHGEGSPRTEPVIGGEPFASSQPKSSPSDLVEPSAAMTILSDAGLSALKQYFTTPKEVLRRIPARYLKTTVSYSPLAKWLAPALLSEIADMSFEEFTKEFQEVHPIPNADWAVFEREAKDVLEKAQHFSRMMASNAGMQSLLS